MVISSTVSTPVTNTDKKLFQIYASSGANNGNYYNSKAPVVNSWICANLERISKDTKWLDQLTAGAPDVNANVARENFL